MRDLSIRLVRAFFVLAQEGQFKAAAERFHVTQSAFSQMIARLEGQVGTRLVDRTSRGAFLTTQGVALLPLATEIVEKVEAAYRTMRREDECREHSIAVSAIPALTAEWLPAILAKFKSVRPTTQVKLFDFADSDRNLEMLRERQTDFTIVPDVSDTGDFEFEPLFEESFFLVCSRADKLAGKSEAYLRDLAGCTFLHLRSTSSIARILAPLLEEVDLVHSGFVAESHGTVAGLVANGFGVSVVPASSLDHYKHPDHVLVPLLDPALRRRMHVLWRTDAPLSGASRALLDLIVASPFSHAAPARCAPAAFTARSTGRPLARTGRTLQ
jgi:LysR family carnitine catabolism transcriptional activator